ncbi:MAG: hypothetical protein K2Y09_11185 [Nitrosomonas sp.]|uniref:hypothetical protein n=1 Tax=Nitrosomonas sp. TaxID=42353 RepID=UPI001DFA5209|nr:hypothetical protein [Nitrosomonas sp.]MBX9895722.1 hypothetical protein [Nitrosomonas sp.]
MKQNLRNRIQQLEERAMDKKPLVPALIWISGLPDSQTREEAMTEYEKRHGFPVPADAPVIEIQAYDASKPIHK